MKQIDKQLVHSRRRECPVDTKSGTFPWSRLPEKYFNMHDAHLTNQIVSTDISDSSIEVLGSRGNQLWMPTVQSNFPECDVFFVREHQASLSSQGQNIYDDVANFLAVPGIIIILSQINATSPYAPSPRRYHQCSVILSIFLENLKMLGIFDKALLQGFPTATKPQSDYYIFLAPSTSTSELLLAASIHRKIKNKIVISLNPEHYANLNNNKIYAETVCIFCDGDSGAIKSSLINESTSIDHIFPDWTKNGQGYKLRITSPTIYKIIIELKLVRGKLEMQAGQNKQVIEYLFPRFNFSFTIFTSTGDNTGRRLSNGTYNGVLGDILYDKADMGLCTSYNYMRYSLIGFTKGTQYVWGTFYVGPPKPLYSWKAIFSPFSYAMWIGVIVSLGGVIGIFHIIQMNHKETRLSAMRIGFVLVGQSIEYPKSISARLMLCVWLFCSVVLSTSYVSKIVGFLAFPEVATQPKNFIELADPKFGYEWGMNLKDGNLYRHFETSPNPIFRKIFAEKEPPKTSEACLKAATERNFACITWKQMGDYFAFRNFTIKNGKSPLVVADQDKPLFVPLGFAVKINSILLPTFDKAIGSLVESGQGQKWEEHELVNIHRKKIHWEKATGGTKRNSSSTEKNLLSLKNLMGVFYMLIFGSFLSIMSFSGEYLLPKVLLIFWNYVGAWQLWRQFEHYTK